MRVVLQRVDRGCVTVDGQTIAEIGLGMVILLGVGPEDGEEQINYLVNKIANLRIFEDDRGRMNHALTDTGGQMLVISQFTLLGDCRKGRRPSFVHAARPEDARRLYRRFVDRVRQLGIDTQTGRFGAMMQVSIINDGPVTLLVQSR
jgi:D-tyrosyl-tRNA(Tyr) deacylase